MACKAHDILKYDIRMLILFIINPIRESSLWFDGDAIDGLFY